MSNRKRIKANENIYKQIWKLFSAMFKRLINWLLRSLLVMGRRARLSRSGFVLPTVAMMILVVMLLTTAIMVRSFDRSKNASNVRVNQVVLNAAAPALDRAKAKIEDVLAKLAGKIPSDLDLNTYFTNQTYTLGGETRLEVAFDINKNNIIQSQPGTTYVLENDETITTAWKFPVDTDNNGKFDSYTLYGIYYRSPSRDTTTGIFNRARNSLEARTPPMSGGTISGQCPSATGTSASLVGSSSWYKTGANLAKSFFVYTATVPITSLPNNPPFGTTSQYEKYIGNKGFSAIEFQQDRIRIPLLNNVVVYNDDVEVTPGPTFRLNGRLVTNGNLLVGNSTGSGVYLFQVSSPYSCYYQEENSKIVVGGNVAANGLIKGDPDLSNSVSVDLFNGVGNSPGQDGINSTNKSTNNKPYEIAYNSNAYVQRVNRLVTAQLANSNSTDPSDVQKLVNAVPTTQQAEERKKQLEIYFSNRTRRVPFFEVPYGGNALGSYATTSPLQGSNDTLRPPDAWMYPTNPSDGKTGTGYTGLTLKTDQLQATEPQTEKQNGTENKLGDRVQAGNNLPALWFNNGAFAGANTQQNISGATWTQGPGSRYRQTHVQALADLGITDRDGFWEQAAAAKPISQLDNNGGLRLVTGAGVYQRNYSFLPPPTYDNPTTPTHETSLTTYDDPATTPIEQYPMVWPDSMPMSPGSTVFDQATGGWIPLPATLPTVPTSTNDPYTPDSSTPNYAKGDLRMRATAVYHYAQSTYDPTTPANYQTPIACVSSYYDPSSIDSSKNVTTFAGKTLPWNTDVKGKSNNGIVYQAPTTTATSITSVSGPDANTGKFDATGAPTPLLGKLYYQANLKFPNGRFVNEPLRNALKAKASDPNHYFTLSEQSAIDSTICSLQILDGTLSPSTTPTPGVTILNGAIREIAFLDARQIQAIDEDDPTTYPVETFTTDGNPNIPNSSANLTGNYDLDIEQRQPLEIRATALDMNSLRQQQITGSNVIATNLSGTSEYLMPNSGIIYASRDDALPDLSDKTLDSKKVSPTDFKLDPTRRPHSILLTNGSNLSRPQNFNPAEKGLILATNLPVYVNGDFNIHTHQEFTNLLANDWSNFYNRTVSQIDPNFACRTGDPRLPNCTQGDQWRSATVLADAVTLLSNDFKFGFRNDGDYDLRNNDGSWDSINKRLKNGLWNNNFVTSRNFQDSIYSGNTATTNDDSSYFNNFVTPIQRRVKFPEYVMEICRKLPVSECQANDWVVGFDMNGDADLEDPVTTFDANGDGVIDQYDTEKVIKANRLGQALVKAGKNSGANNILSDAEVQWSTQFGIGNKSPLERLGAGTTARAALVAADQRYGRRVAFARTQFNTLVFTDIGTAPNFNETPQPLGVSCPLDANGTTPQPQNSGCQYPGSPGSSTATAGTHYGNPANNALWFGTTNNTSGRPFCKGSNNPAGSGCTNDDRSYAANNPLYYLSPEQGGNKLILPPTPEIPGVPSLNIPVGNPASSYTICTKNDGASNNYSNSSSTTLGLNCNSTGAFGVVDPAIVGFLALNPDASTTDNIVWATRSGSNGTFPTQTAGQTTIFTNNPPTSPQAGYIVNVIDINGDFAVNNNDTIIKIKGNQNSVFVFRSSGSSLDFGSSSGCSTCHGVQLVSDGVDPNNVFWAINSNMKWNDVNPAFPHTLAGTILNKGTGSPKWNTLIVAGGRILGVNGKPSTSNFSTDTRVYATGSIGQPSLVPVLQIQNTNGTPPTNPNNSFYNNVGFTRWMMKATNTTTFNLAAAAGDTPPRANSSTSLYESNGGLYNFVRFLENWTTSTTAKIGGSFIQLKRSAYATAPWSSVFSSSPSGIFNDPLYYPQGYRDYYQLLGNGGYLPYYVPPDRQWGFDVGLLSQSPDLFAQKLTVAPTNPPNEFFREVGRDDPWIQILLCAAQKDSTGNYSSYAVDTDQRPPSCPALPYP